MAFRWMTERWKPALDMIPAELRARLEDAELYHQILEHNWYLAEQADAEVPLAGRGQELHRHGVESPCRRTGRPARRPSRRRAASRSDAGHAGRLRPMGRRPVVAHRLRRRATGSTAARRRRGPPKRGMRPGTPAARPVPRPVRAPGRRRCPRRRRGRGRRPGCTPAGARRGRLPSPARHRATPRRRRPGSSAHAARFAARFQTRPSVMIWLLVGGVAMVQHRKDEELEADVGASPVAGHQRQPGSEAASGARPADRNACRIDAQVVGVVGEPRQRRVAVAQRPPVPGASGARR